MQNFCQWKCRLVDLRALSAELDPGRTIAQHYIVFAFSINYPAFGGASYVIDVFSLVAKNLQADTGIRRFCVGHT